MGMRPGKRAAKYGVYRLAHWLIWIVLSGCSVLPVAHEHATFLEPIRVETDQLQLPAAIAHTLNRPDDLWGQIGWHLSWDHSSLQIDRERARILQQPLFFQVLSERANPALAWIVKEVTRRQLPMELALIPIVESMLDPWAYSHQRAAGLWQVSPGTAAHYGLEQNWWYDARLDIPVATDFALSYLEELHAAFDNDWLLALAAYNGGRGRVSRAIARAKARGQSTDYWSLRLPSETHRYIPRLIALAQILRDPTQYNVTLPQLDADPNIVAIDTGGQIELAKAAQLAGVEPGELRRLNPAQLRWATAPDQSGVLWFPEDNSQRVIAGLRQLPEEERVEWAHYRIAPGDSLGSIAKRFNTQVALIQSVNNLHSHFIRAGDDLVIPKTPHASQNGRDSLQLTSIEWPPKRSPTSARRYQVRAGDSLWVIARRHGTTVERLRRLNGLANGQHLMPGQILQLAH